MTTDGVDQCTFRCSISDAEYFSDLDGGEWRCPRRTHREHSVCLFHLPLDERDVDAETVATRFREIVEGRHDDSSVPNRQRFIGAIFEELDFRHMVLDGPDTWPIDLREAQFAGPVDFSHAVIGHPVHASGATFEAPVRFEDCETGYRLQFDGAVFEALAVFDDATVETLDCRRTIVKQLCRCRRITVRRDINFSNSDIEGVTFEGATVGAALYLEDVDCQRRARIDGIDVSGVLSLSRTKFNNGLWGTQATIGDGLLANDAMFWGPTHLQNAAIRGTSRIQPGVFDSVADFRDTSFRSVSFNPATFNDEARFDNAEFEDLSLESVRVSGALSLQEVTVIDTAKLNNVSFPEVIDCRDGEFRRLVIEEPDHDVDHGTIDLRGATIEAGRFGQSTDGLIYDLERGAVGAVTLDDSPPPPPLQWYRFLRTDFAGFDFSSHKLAFAESDWQLHLDDDDPRGAGEQSQPSAVDLEVTYLKGKNGASNTGDSEAVSHFYRKEMKYRRKKHVSQFLHNPRPFRRFRAGTSAFFNLFLGATTGHGELSRRVVAWSAAVIGVFGLVYWQYLTPPLTTGEGFVDYLALSTQIFLTFILGTEVEASSVLLTVTAATEGFIGAFFIALFVFTLTRSIKR